MKQKTLDYLGKYQTDPRPFCGFRAIMETAGRMNLPNYYHTDLAHDAHTLYKAQPACFVYCLRDCGSHLFVDGTDLTWFDAVAHAFRDDSQNWFVYDEDVLVGYDNLPSLHPVCMENARLFLQRLTNGHKVILPDPQAPAEPEDYPTDAQLDEIFSAAARPNWT